MMVEKGAAHSWMSCITHMGLKQVHDQVNHDASGVMKHIFQGQRPEYHYLWSLQGPRESSDIRSMFL